MPAEGCGCLRIPLEKQKIQRAAAILQEAPTSTNIVIFRHAASRGAMPPSPIGEARRAQLAVRGRASINHRSIRLTAFQRVLPAVGMMKGARPAL